ncbi:bifunctional glutamate N-acetyltransferase/amino-acid acetyltransferase ArgJ [Pseudohongiella spirulinae]|uniref:Arginine biosynthesis bifunctional protein ArgJ n=1 Tax=Pseudohongiella spirulinae TaxID=1249552 RepID=A0A0S2KF99_9GAMM|nr:bifunctional glutamate N-acetyltransferase/amino-acid acetyltransferase ArgJ [Pseudohongiella spirulinae]ALO46921.1 Arginine biosynthesis bifunctional protein ArgJ [Pseudohongiella spirulinae]
MATGKQDLDRLLPIEGVKIAAVQAGVRYANRYDVVVMALSAQCRTAGVFTQNAFCAAPVVLARQYLQSSQGRARYLLINTGNANAGTGQQGMADARNCCQSLAELTGVSADQVLPFSTGVIGERLPAQKIVAALPGAMDALQADNWLMAAKGIMTTDTRPKGLSVSLEHQGQRITVTGITKGAGMIKPNMATMLAFVATDADIAQELLQNLLRTAVEYSFNRITVDGDTSTNDCCMLVASGASGVVIDETDSDLLAQFSDLLNNLMIGLARQIIHDAEGARKFVTVQVNGGADSQECLKVAYAIAESPLVKTALTASDPNWGRILAAIGRAGVADLNVDLIDIYLGDVALVNQGGLAPDYTEAQGQSIMSQENIELRIELGRGQVSETVWTSDLSEEYVRINASYRS